MNDDDIRSGVLVALSVLAVGVLVGVLYPAPLSILFLGLVLGSLSGLVAMGLVLIYRANRIVNFAQGDIGGAAAVLAASLIVGPGWNPLLAMAVGLLAALALGGATEVLVIRRFAKAPRLVLTVATIGLAQLFAVVQLGLPRLFDYDVVPQPPLPFDFRFTWSPVVFNAGHVLILVVVPVVAAGLAMFFRRTRVGVGVRAAAESSDRAALLGVPVKRINTLVWILAAGVSGVGVLLRLPIQGVSIGDVLGPSLLLRALAAAVIGRMESLPRTLGAALVLGMVEQAVLYQTGRTLVVDAVLFGVILVTLLVQRGGIMERARDAGASTWTALREVRPIPRELRAQPLVQRALVGLAVAGATALVLVPLTWSPSQMSVFGVGVIFAMLLCSLVVLTGWAGQISLGHLAFAAFGAAVAGTLSQRGHDFLVCLAAAALVGMVVALAIGVPALRIRGPFFAVTSLAFALATGAFFLNPEFFPWLVPDRNVGIQRPILFNRYDLASEHAYYYVLLVVFAFVAAMVWRLRTSRTGRTLVAIRDNHRAAQAFGISPVRAQMTAFAVSGLVAGLAGGLFVFQHQGLSGRLLDPMASIGLFLIGVVGSLGSVPGAVIGASYLTFVEFSAFTTTPISRLFASAVGVLFILMVLPGGLGGLFYDLRDGLLRRYARARGLVVPSLLADVATLEGRGEVALTGAEVRRARTTPPSADPLLLVRDLEVAYGKTQVLFGVDFHVERGEIVALLGTNGAGKSTLLSAIAGLIPPAGGTVSFEGADITGHQPFQTVGAGIVLAPGGKGVFPTLTVGENLALAGWPYQNDPDHVARATEQVLAFFPIVRTRWDERAGNLSGGEQQMLTLGQAFIARPRLLMIDELSLGLAPVVVEQLLGIVRAIHANGTTVVLVEQSVNVAITLAERAVFLEKGEVRFDGPTAELLDRPEILRAVFLQGAAAAEAAGSGAPAAPGGATGAGAAVTVGGNGRQPFRPQCETCGHEHPVRLELREVSARFGGVQAVKDVSLAVREGQILGVIGPNGAGKTTVFDIISGFVTPTSGTVLLEGEDVTELSPAERARRGLGRSFQDARLFPAMTVRQAIATALERHVEVPEPTAAVVLSPAVKVSERAVAEEVDRLIELMHLGAFADKFVGELSTGSRRIVDLACVLAHRPSVLLLDEPSSGIAQRETEALGPVLLDIRDRTGAALVVIEHDMPLITSISDELVALEVGSVVARGEPGAVINDPRVVEGYLGGDEAVIHRSGRRPGPGGGDGEAVRSRANRRPRRREPLRAGGR